MADQPVDLMPIHLRRLDGAFDRHPDGQRALMVRMMAVEENLAGVYRRIGGVEFRIERRLDLVDAPH